MTSSKNKRKKKKMKKKMINSWDIVSASEVENINLFIKEKQTSLFQFLSQFIFVK